MDFVKRIEALYEEYVGFWEKINRTHYDFSTYTLPKLHEELKPRKKVTGSSLDRLKFNSYLRELLLSLPPEKVLKDLGKEVVLWAWVNSTIDDDLQGDFEQVIDNSLGINMELLINARKAVWRDSRTRDFKQIMNLYTRLNGLETVLPMVPLFELLCTHASKEIMFSEEKREEYQLQPLMDRKLKKIHTMMYAIKNKNQEKIFSIYLDAPGAFALCYKNEPQAVAAYTCSTPSTLLIPQLQGINWEFDRSNNIKKKRHARGLVHLDWQASLVDIVAYIGRRQGFTQLGIQSGYNNDWTQKYDEKGKVHLPLDVALQKYDAVAERLGFIQREDKNWYKIIE